MRRLAKPVVPIALSARSRVGTRCIVSAGDGCIVGDGNGCIAEVSLLLSSSSLSPSLVLAPRLVSSPLVSFRFIVTVARLSRAVSSLFFISSRLVSSCLVTRDGRTVISRGIVSLLHLVSSRLVLSRNTRRSHGYLVRYRLFSSSRLISLQHKLSDQTALTARQCGLQSGVQFQ